MGDGDARALFQQQAAALRVTDRVRFLGWVDDATRTRMLAESDLLCLPSAQEGFGIVLLEAVGCASKPEPIKPRSAQTVVLAGEKKSIPVRTRLYEQLTLELPPVKEEGYRWELFSHDARVFQQVTALVPATGPEHGPTVSFIAIHVVPRSLVRFLLVKSDRVKESAVVDGQDVIVTVEE